MKLYAVFAAMMIAAPTFAPAEIIINQSAGGSITFPAPAQQDSDGTVYGGSNCRIQRSGSNLAIQGCSVTVQPSTGDGGFFIKKGPGALETAGQARRNAAGAASGKGFFD